MITKFLQPNIGFIRLLLCSLQKTAVGDSSDAYRDNELVRKIQNGDLQSFEELFNMHQKRVYNIALRILANETEAADATQEVFVRVYQSINKLAFEAAFVT